MTRTPRSVVGATLLLLLAGCSLVPGGVNAALDGEWRLQAGTHQGAPIPLVPGHPITLNVDGTQVGGTSACNSYGGKLQIDGSGISISDLVQTEMACTDDGVMASEAAYTAALALVTAARRDGDSLVMTGPQVELRFVVTPPIPDTALIGPVWLLDSLINGEAVSSTAAEARLQLNSDGTLTASTGCRSVTGHFTVTGNQVEVALDPFDAIGCADGLGDQDEKVLAVIDGTFSVLIQGEVMTLSAGDKGLGYRVSAGD